MGAVTMLEDLALLQDTAREAGALALRYWNTRLKWQRKSDGTAVTEADFAVDALLAERLRGARPDYGWLSEETSDGPDRLDRRRLWLLDPIDGTRDFMAGGEEWTIALSLIEDGVPVLSVIYNPVRDELFTAMRGHGAFLGGAPIRVSEPDGLPHARILASDGVIAKPIWRDPWPLLIPMKVNSTTYRIACVACGRADASFAIKDKWEWDVAGGALLVQEAGGLATAPDGQPLVFNRAVPRVPGYLAAGKNLHAVLVDRLTHGLKEEPQRKRPDHP